MPFSFIVTRLACDEQWMREVVFFHPDKRVLLYNAVKSREQCIPLNQEEEYSQYLEPYRVYYFKEKIYNAQKGSEE